MNQYTVLVVDDDKEIRDGISATFNIREQKNIPIIILSAKTEETDKILGLQVGADDYVTKPFNPLELIARVKSQLRRYVTLGQFDQKNKTIDLNGLTIDQEAKEVAVNGERCLSTWRTSFFTLKLFYP
jgi:DNA-binding response OmpR family regulator